MGIDRRKKIVFKKVMDRYEKVQKPKIDNPIKENEIRITTQGRLRNYITYATNLLLQVPRLSFFHSTNLRIFVKVLHHMISSLHV